MVFVAIPWTRFNAQYRFNQSVSRSGYTSWHVFIYNTCNSPYFVICFIQCHFVIQNLTIKNKDNIRCGRLLKSLNVIYNVFVECNFACGLYCKFTFICFLLCIWFLKHNLPYFMELGFSIWGIIREINIAKCSVINFVWWYKDSIVINICQDFVSYDSFNFQNLIIRNCKIKLWQCVSNFFTSSLLMNIEP